MADGVRSGRGKYLYKDVVEKLLGMIQCGELRPGGKLPPERTLAETLKVSRNCVRQAIQALAERKILESRRGDGTYVRAPDDAPVIESFGMVIRARKDLLREILEFRLLVEPRIASLAARNITREELDRLKIIVCDQQRRILAGAEDSELDAAFHLGLATASKNRIVKKVMSTVSGILDESRRESLWSEARRRTSVVGHLKIIDALENRDPDMACKAMEEHLSAIERIILGDDGTGMTGEAEGLEHDGPGGPSVSERNVE
ncbi:MAG: FadR/GntR family transcriptional regulator [Syntrophobacteraceae bacterium]|nr:FadR family transcriptional regulator [Desulfobacteraceae bacterium]